ncbi:MAG: hypothetical protein HYX75_02045 [Acidobacteria bacterium]|nr:hypothetical protein [Acidobacteriota bacterium]
MDRRNVNRGFRQLRVWQDAVALYDCKVENGLLKLIKALRRKRIEGEWAETFPAEE